MNVNFGSSLYISVHGNTCFSSGTSLYMSVSESSRKSKNTTISIDCGSNCVGVYSVTILKKDYILEAEGTHAPMSI